MPVPPNNTPYIFQNVEVLSLSQEYRFLGAGFNFASTKNIVVRGLIESLTTTYGITGIWTGIYSELTNNNEFGQIILNNFNLGTGRLLSLNFEPGDDVRIKSYTASLVVFDSGNLFNFSGSYYTGIDIGNFQYLDAFNETYNFNRKQNLGYSYDHKADIKFNSGVGTLYSIGAAQNLAKTLFTGSQLGFAFYSGFTSKQGRRLYSEVYNIIDNTCSFDEIFDFDSNSGNYSVTRTNAFTLSENGIINVIENALIRGITIPTWQQASNALAAEMSGAYDRCNVLYQNYGPANDYDLITTPTVRGTVFDVFNNRLEYSLTFSNDRSNSGIYIWNYEDNFTRQPNGVWLCTEQGQVIGKAQNRTLAFANAQTGINLVDSTISPRISGLYLSELGSGYNFMDSKSWNFVPNQGQINYSYNFSNEPILPSTGGVKKIQFTSNKEEPIYQYNKFNVFNFKEFIQDAQQTRLGSKDVEMTLIGDSYVSLPIYLENAKSQLNTLLPTGIDVFISDSSYDFNPNENTLQVKLDWKFNQIKQTGLAL
jgi:hypothetical protein